MTPSWPWLQTQVGNEQEKHSLLPHLLCHASSCLAQVPFYILGLLTTSCGCGYPREGAH